MNEPEEYTLRWRGRETGPFSLSEINRQLDGHEIGTGHEIFYEDNWITLDEFLNAQKVASAPIRVELPTVSEAPIPKPRVAEITPDARPRNRMIYAFLAIFSGYIGAHNFYARQWLTGLLQLLLTVATCLMGFGIIASWLWAVVEAVVVHKDGNGIDMI